jgi:hypothetical protein
MVLRRIILLIIDQYLYQHKISLTRTDKFFPLYLIIITCRYLYYIFISPLGNLWHRNIVLVLRMRHLHVLLDLPIIEHTLKNVEETRILRMIYLARSIEIVCWELWFFDRHNYPSLFIVSPC